MHRCYARVAYSSDAPGANCAIETPTASESCSGVAVPEASTASAPGMDRFPAERQRLRGARCRHWILGNLAGQEQREAQQPTVPARADPQRAGTALRQLDRHRVLELQHRPAIPSRHKADLQEACLTAERHAEAVGPVALEDVAAGIALELEGAADPQVAQGTGRESAEVG